MEKGKFIYGAKTTYIYESMVITKVMYGYEGWVLNADDRHRLEVFEMKGLRNMCGVTRRDRIRNVRIREWCGWERKIISRYEEGLLRWYGHIVRMDEERLVRRVYEGVVDGNRGRGRPKRKWMDGVREALVMRGVLGDGREIAVDRIGWRGVVYGGGLVRLE